MVNVINNGYIDNVSNVIVELPTYIDQFGLHPQKIGDLLSDVLKEVKAPEANKLLQVEHVWKEIIGDTFVRFVIPRLFP